MRRRLLFIVLYLPLLCTAQSDGPLSPFSKLIGGKWEAGDSYQTFEWGVGQTSVIGKSYFVIDGEATLVSEGSWYWHPGEQKIKGHFTAINMPIALFDYTTTFDGDTIRNDLRAYDRAGNELRYEELWEFTGNDEYTWTLMRVTESDNTREMSATYQRTK